jgi:hypothetical protein
MSAVLTEKSVATLKELLDQLSRLEGGTISTGSFIHFFRSLRWDSVDGFSTTDLAPFGWAIETMLMEYDDDLDDPNLPDDLRLALQTVINRDFPEASIEGLSLEYVIDSIPTTGEVQELTGNVSYLPVRRTVSQGPSTLVVTVQNLRAMAPGWT